MNLNQLNQIADSIKQKYDGFLDVSSWDMFIREEHFSKQEPPIRLCFLQEDADGCYIVGVDVWGNYVGQNDISLTRLYRIGYRDLDEYYEDIAQISGIEKHLIWKRLF